MGVPVVGSSPNEQQKLKGAAELGVLPIRGADEKARQHLEIPIEDVFLEYVALYSAHTWLEDL